ncbi:MAG: hypothetical protein QM702_20645 [Rubrivivax sp.]
MAIALVYLLIVVNFQSWVDGLIIISALPGRDHLDAARPRTTAERCRP